MSSLTDRIRGIVKAPPQSRIPDSQFPIPNSSSLDVSSLGGTWRDGCFIVERRWEPAARHGRETIGSYAESVDASAGDAVMFTGAARAPFVFFDLETTGLSGGAGTHAFLVGCGCFDAGGAFLTRQFLMTRYADERLLLETVASELARAFL